MSREFTPIASSTHDGEEITLCRILEAVAPNGALAAGFPIPQYNDVEFLYQNGSFPTQPTYITFKQNGTPVYYIYLQYDGNGALTRVAQD